MKQQSSVLLFCEDLSIFLYDFLSRMKKEILKKENVNKKGVFRICALNYTNILKNMDNTIGVLLFCRSEDNVYLQDRYFLYTEILLSYFWYLLMRKNIKLQILRLFFVVLSSTPQNNKTYMIHNCILSVNCIPKVFAATCIFSWILFFLLWPWISIYSVT